jgi:hypothetical protein
MNNSEQILYERIMCFSFNDGNEMLPFEKRLSLENGWTDDFCTRVIDEYKRFVFLAIVAGHSVSPSDQIDQVWHLHLIYSKSYWNHFCPQVLGKELHHMPTNGGPQEMEKFRQWYQDTLDSYHHFFGQKPPEDIWPDVSIRFGEDLYFQRLNTKRHWIIPKQQLNRLLYSATLAMLLLLIFSSMLDLSSGYQQPDVSLEVGFQSKNPVVAVGILALVLSKIKANTFFLFIGMIITILFLALVVDFYIWRRCPQCDRSGAMERTGVTEETGGLFRLDLEEWKCRDCGYRQWKSKSSGGSGGGGGCGGGDGGCGGCGGCGGG